METTGNQTPKPTDVKSSREIAGAASQLADLLTSAKLGARVSGIVLSVDEPRTFTGKNQDGSNYVSHSRRIQLFAGAGAGAVVCGERQESLEQFAPLLPGTFVETMILGAKTEGKQMVFRIKL